MRNFLVFLGIVLALSCATPQPAVEEKAAEPVRPALPKEEQEKKSLEAYNSILELTADVPRRTVIEQLKEKHLEIIRDYPDSYFAEESYLRLIIINFEDYERPRVDEAERYYREYFKNYPKPRLDNVINDTMARNYYRYGYWDRLANFLTPHIEKYVTGGETPKPLYLLMYSESLFYLGDYAEAEKGYLTVIRLFPGSYEARLAETKLKMIEAIKAGGTEVK